VEVQKLLDESADVLTLSRLTMVPPGQLVTGHALIERSAVATDRTGRPYLVLTLRGADGGSLEARWWRYPYPVERRPQVGTVCWLRGQLEVFSGALQLRIVQARPAPELPVETFARATRRSLEELRAELEGHLTALEAPWQGLARAVLSGETLQRFLTWPAAQSRHGAVRHGLLAHSLRVVMLTKALATTYGPALLDHDSHLVVAGALLHDIGKVQTLPAVAGAPLPPAAARIDHITAGVLLIHTAARSVSGVEACLEPLLHILLAHHGRRDWGAPVEPQTIEAWLVHLADLAEARLWAWADQEAS
jgi:3'-5' exoribonuclease